MSLAARIFAVLVMCILKESVLVQQFLPLAAGVRVKHVLGYSLDLAACKALASQLSFVHRTLAPNQRVSRLREVSDYSPARSLRVCCAFFISKGV